MAPPLIPYVFPRVTTRDGAIRNDRLGSFLGAVKAARDGGVRVWEPGQQQYGHGTATCRNMAVAEFLKTPCTHLFFMDDDNVLPKTAIAHLAETAAAGLDVVAGAYPMLKFYAPTVPTLYTSTLPLGKVLNSDWMSDFHEGVVEVEAAGTGCMMIGRWVLEALGHPWFRWPERHNPQTGRIETMTDDVDFCARARFKGYKIWSDGRVRCGHFKEIDLLTLFDGRMCRANDRTASVAAGYDTHLPVMALVASRTPVRVVVEYGSGRFSTPGFLRRELFPDLERLVSFEHHPEWLEEARQAYTDDRLELRGCVLSEVHHEPAPEADLVLIDCDERTADGVQDYRSRWHLIEKYSADPRAVVVVHDANFMTVKPAVEAADYRYKAVHAPAAGPHTALLSNAVDVGAVLAGAGAK